MLMEDSVRKRGIPQANTDRMRRDAKGGKSQEDRGLEMDGCEKRTVTEGNWITQEDSDKSRRYTTGGR